MSDIFSVFASAKLNLALNIVGRRADGYHLLDSLFAFCGLADELRFEPSDDLTLGISGPWGKQIEEDTDNLVLRAARLLRHHAGTRAGAAIHLIKHIPVAAGLGGGSADAAAALRGLNRFWNLHYAEDQLLALAAKLGADVPACLASHPVLATGIGDVLKPLPPLPPCGILLANPRVATPTPAVFGAFARANPTIAPRSLVSLEQPFADLDELVAALSLRGNDLLDAAVSVTPVIAQVLQVLKALPDCRYAHLSGSGATCFGLFATAELAADAAAKLAVYQSTWWRWNGELGVSR
jgi:4-diphosphocytidyl-2-C-methyl-D-erythritol kinase